MNRNKAAVDKANMFQQISEFFKKKDKHYRLSKSMLKRMTFSSIYSPHSNELEKSRNLRNFPSKDLSRFHK